MPRRLPSQQAVHDNCLLKQETYDFLFFSFSNGKGKKKKFLPAFSSQMGAT